MFKPAHLKRPPEEPLPTEELAKTYYGEVWLRYPLEKHAFPMHHGANFKATCELYVLANEITCRSFTQANGQRSLPAAEAQRLRHRLAEWYRRLPLPLTPKRIVFPMQLKLQ